jgi:hypothetical protein
VDRGSISTLARLSLPFIGRRNVAHSFNRDGNHATVTWNSREASGIGRQSSATATVDQTTDRLAAPEVGRVVVDAIAPDLDRRYEHDGMPKMRRTRNRPGVAPSDPRRP